MKVVLKKVWSGSALSERYVGDAEELPKIGKVFKMICAPMPGAATGFIETPPVMHVVTLDYNYLRFYTDDAVFELEVIDQPVKEEAA